MTRVTEKIISILLVMFLLIYVGYQAFRYCRKPVTVETVYEYNVSRSLDTNGIAIRNEMVMNESVFGVENYLFDDGTKVTVGETVAEFYKNNIGDKGLRRSQELEKEIALLREAQDPSASNLGNIEAYNRDIKDQLGRLSAMSSTGRYRDISNMRQSLTSLLNKKQVATEKTTNFSARIAQLETELESLERFQSSEAVTAVVAPVSGYFSKEVDGYETKISAKDLDNYTREDYLKLLSGEPPQPSTGKVGKMVLSPNWYFAASVPKDEVDGIKSGQQVHLQFEQVSNPVPASVSEVLSDKDENTAVLLLESSYISDELINLRKSNVVISFQQFTGLRINTADLRFRTNKDGVSERGVYILRNNTAYFRLIDPIYEEQSFVLSRTYYTSEDYLEPQRRASSEGEVQPSQAPASLTSEPEKPPDNEESSQSDDQEPSEGNDTYKRYVLLFDQVITKGNDVYHGKSIQ